MIIRRRRDKLPMLADLPTEAPYEATKWIAAELVGYGPLPIADNCVKLFRSELSYKNLVYREFADDEERVIHENFILRAFGAAGEEVDIEIQLYRHPNEAW